MQEWHGNCTNPNGISYSPALDKWFFSNEPTINSHWTLVRCNNCFKCKAFKEHKWKFRLLKEYSIHDRTWFCTWTWRKDPAELVLTWQRFMKRLRKASHGNTLKYFTVAEKGTQHSRMHLHSLIFCSNSTTFRKVTSKWQAGYSAAKLAQPEHISYVIKYATKSPISRIMASQNLGLSTPPLQTDPMWYQYLMAKRKPEWGDTVVSPVQQVGYRSAEVQS